MPYFGAKVTDILGTTFCPGMSVKSNCGRKRLRNSFASNNAKFWFTKEWRWGWGWRWS